ncbi:MAG: hypothetical protein QXS85_00010 [Acidilobaceae archaeon]
MYCLVATLGFDIDFVARRLSREPRPSRVALVGLRVDESGWGRVRKAFGLLQVFCESVGAECVLDEVRPETAVKEMAGILEREARGGCSELELYLTGGPRIAVAAAILAAITGLVGVKAAIVVEGEAFEARLEIPVEPLRRLLSLPEVERRIVVEAVNPVRPKDIQEKLKISKPASYRKLRSLAEAGFLRRPENVEEEVYVTTDEFRKLLKLFS